MGYFEGQPAVVVERRLGNSESPFSNMDESLTINNDGKVILSEIPNELERVIVTGDNITWYEIENGLPKDNEFKVDYINKIITFSKNNIGKQLNFHYFGEGNHYYSPNTIYTKLNNGKVTETLGDLITELRDVGDVASGIAEDEEQRQKNETERQNEETIRQSNEQTRINQENERETKTNNALLEINNITNNLIHLGEYNPSNQYYAYNIVSYQGSSYMNILDSKGISPTESSNWQQIGLRGQGLVAKGTYDSTVTYLSLDIVEYQGSSYICKTESTGNLPTDTSYFTLLASQGLKGDKGDQGLQGIQGEQGLKGEKGDPGESFIWKGEYNPSKTYVVNDTVGYNGSSYICIKNTTIGILPTDTNYFNLLSQRGIDGSGSIVTINGKSPDLNGNVQLDASEIGAILSSEKGVAGGVAKLDENGQVVDADNNPVSGAVESVNGQTGKVNLDIPTKTSDLTNDSDYETTTGSQEKADNALQSAKDYTMEAIVQSIKLANYTYVLTATSDNQTEFIIPLETFNPEKDFLQVVQNVIILNKDEHYTVVDKTITLNEGVTQNTSIFISIVRLEVTPIT
ncbi:collagen-like protein [Heyndrickxia oleronia]|uniref:collagen-like triple helix repeat-containing protein n=1 Tax=Heyndrickxia oleronia TaxID=38875 RepID=UPI003F1FB751